MGGGGAVSCVALGAMYNLYASNKAVLTDARKGMLGKLVKMK